MKHGFFKRCAHINCNFKNIPKSLTWSHQYYSSYNFFSGICNKSTFSLGAGFNRPIENIPNYEECLNKLNVSAGELVYMCKKLNAKGCLFCVNDILFTANCRLTGCPLFCKIISIFHCQNKWYFLIQKCQTGQFLHHYNAHSIIFLNSYKVLDIIDLQYVHPLDYYKLFDYNVVILRHALNYK